MEQIRRAKAHVRRPGYQKKLETICNASSDKLAAAMECVGENAALRDVLRSADCDADLTETMAKLILLIKICQILLVVILDLQSFKQQLEYSN